MTRQKVPAPQFAPAVDRLHPAAGRFVFGRRLGLLRALDLQQQVAAVLQPHDKVRLISPRLAMKLVRHIQFQPVVSHVADDQAADRSDLQLRGGGLLP